VRISDNAASLLEICVMKGARHRFKLTDASRLVKATTSAGLTVKNVFLTEEGLRVEVDNSAPAAPPAADPKNPLDRILDHAQGRVGM
jgi:hypothetical protein